MSSPSKSCPRSRRKNCRVWLVSRLLLQATIDAFGGSDEGKVLRALDAWLTIAKRQCFYTEADAAAIQGIKADLIEATEAVTEAMDALGDRIDGE